MIGLLWALLLEQPLAVHTHFRALTLQGPLRQFFIFRRACLNLFPEPPTLGDTGIWQGTQTITICPAAKLKGCGKEPGSVWNMFPDRWTPTRVLCSAWSEWPCPEPACEGTSQLDFAISPLPSAHLWVKVLCIPCDCINISPENVRNPLGLFQQLLWSLGYPKSPSWVLGSVSVLSKTVLKTTLFLWCF